MPTSDALSTAYRLVYDAGAGYPLAFNALPLVFVAVGIAANVYARRRAATTWQERLGRPFLVAWTLGAALLSVAVLLASHSRYAYYRDMLAQGKTTTVEGVVTRFSPEPPEGHHHETFDVGGAHFSYSKYVLNEGFNQSNADGGPMRNGLHVRIKALDGHILRLEIAER